MEANLFKQNKKILVSALIIFIFTFFSSGLAFANEWVCGDGICIDPIDYVLKVKIRTDNVSGMMDGTAGLELSQAEKEFIKKRQVAYNVTEVILSRAKNQALVKGVSYYDKENNLIISYKDLDILTDLPDSAKDFCKELIYNLR